MSQHEQYANVLTLEIKYRVATEVLFLKENIDKILEERKRSRHNQFRVPKWVMRGEGINTSHIRYIQQEPSN